MSEFKTILAVASDGDCGKSPLATAHLIARAHGAHLDILHVLTDPTGVVPLVGEGMSSVMVEEIMKVAEREAKERRDRAKAMADAYLAAQPGQENSWREETGREEEVVGLKGRLYDLIVVGRPGEEEDLPSALTLNAALMDSGRPVLIAPPRVPASVGNHPVIAWNGSAEATRAMTAALPVLKKAAKVTILSHPEEDQDPAQPADLIAYLARHGVAAAARDFSPGGAAIGDILLAETMRIGGDLVVMGAYTHSRLRQLILGGVTRHMIGRSEIPVLLAH